MTIRKYFKVVEKSLLIMLNRGCLTLLLIVLESLSSNTLDIQFSTQDVTLLLNETKIISVSCDGSLEQIIAIKFTQRYQSYIEIKPKSFEIVPNFSNYSKVFQVELTGIRAGQFIITSEVIPDGFYDKSNLFVRLKVAKSYTIIIASAIIGWLYFVAWSVGSYPQIYITFKRKSVVGLSFDCLALGLFGNVCYALFNVIMYWNSFVEEEYLRRNPHGLNPVIDNDVGYAVHSAAVAIYTLYQCAIYERGGQTVSYTAIGIVLGLFSIAGGSGILVAKDILHWLDFLYILSYLKLATNLIKYIPQIILNYRRKSTSGWSIENRLLDLAGGIFSILQMILNAYNFDDWASIFGDLTKFGLGMFSFVVDFIFMFQHYVLYRNRSEDKEQQIEKK